MIYDELPKELSRLFGDILIPAEIRELIIKGWDCMIPNEQAQLELKLLNEQDKRERLLIAIMETAKTLLDLPPREELQT